MAQPQARSYNAILGDMVAGFLARKRVPKLKPASPILSILEAAAQSDLRSTQDVFAAMNAVSLERSSGSTLDRIGAGEGVSRRSQRAATGLVTITDTSFTKKSTPLSSAKPAPTAGSTTIYITDATGWPATGSVYIGRGTANYEGPVAYSALSATGGGFWQMTLSTATTRFHQQGESVILAQGGNRQIPAGTQASTIRGLTTQPVSFNTIFSATILDGETSIEGVFVACQTPGTVGNVAAGAISSLNTTPFVGAAVSNPSALVSGRDSESDADYRDRIIATRSTRSRGTDLAVQNAALGVSSDIDSKSVVSAAIVRRENQPTTLYIDDGTGFEESDGSVAIEALVDSATGGEEFFQLSLRPVAKAYVATQNTAPYVLATDSHLAVAVGGFEYDHYFDPQDFRTVVAATAYEIAASINRNSTLPFSARTINGGTGVAIFAKEESNEDIQVMTATTGSDANSALAFGVTKIETIRLYKNDVLLSKDGREAAIISAIKSSWLPFSSTSETLIVSVDGTPAVTYTFNAASFVNAGTGYSTFGQNTVEAWVKVLNYTIPGITASAVGSAIQLISNADRSSRASIAITGGTLTDKGMFAIKTATGRDADYTLNRNTGELRLATPLSLGDSLTVGTFNTRGFVQSAALSTVTTATTGNMWWVVDGGASRVTISVDTLTSFGLTKNATGAWGERWHLTAATGTPFANVVSGDWLVLWDTAVNAGLRGVWRVATVLASGATLAFDTIATGVADTASFTFAVGDLRVIRSSHEPVNVQVVAGTYTASSLATIINNQLAGATASVYRTTRVRVKTNSFGLDGDIALVAQDLEAQLLGFSETTSATQNLTGHLASVVAGNTEIGTIDFVHRITSSASTALNNVEVFSSSEVARSWNKFVVGEKTPNFVGTTPRWGNNSDFHSMITGITTVTNTDLTLRSSAPRFWAQSDALYLASAYAIGPNDTMTTVIDGDIDSKRFVVPMYRRLKPTTATYGASNDMVDADNSNLSLTGAFGLGYSFNDFAVYMKSRLLTHSADANKRILWRWKRFGADGDWARLRYAYPLAASQPLQVTVDNRPTQAALRAYNLVSVRLPSGAARVDDTYLPRDSTRIGYGYNTVGGLDVLTICCGFPVTSASRTTTDVTLTLGLTMGLYNVSNHGLVAGDVIYLASTSGSFSSGLKVITTVGATTITYAEAGTAAGPIANIGSVSTDTVERRLNTGSVIVGDIIRLADSTFIPLAWRNRSFRINNLGDRYIQGYADYDDNLGTPGTTLTYQSLGSASNLSIFPIDGTANTATAIAASVNALGATCPVTATVTGTGSGTIALSSRDESPGTVNELVEYAALIDGVNWVSTTTSPGTLAGNYTLAFKAPITAALASNSDWINEEIRIAPVTAIDVVRWLNTLGISGLAQVAEVGLAANGRAPQIASVTPGSGGSVQIQGGTANAASASIVGSLTALNASSGPVVVSIPADQSLGFSAGMMAEVANAAAPSRALAIDNTLTANDAAGNLTFGGTSIISAGLLATTSLTTIQVRKQGRFVMMAGFTTPPSATEKMINITQGGSSPVSTANTGTFRIIASAVSNTAGAYAVWFENPNAIEEDGKTVSIRYVTSGPMAGDYFAIDGEEWGVANKGLWRIQSVSYTTQSIQLDTSERAWVAQTTPTVALGLNASKYRFIAASKVRHIGRIESISPHATNPLLVDVKMDMVHDTDTTGAITYSRSIPGDYEISDVYGAVLASLDKLDFDTSIVPGIDAYRYNTGLLAEVNRVVMGDLREPEAYPGVVAAGTNIAISGPLVKRIQVSLAIRLRLGVLPQDAIAYVRSAVAGAINTFGVGKSVVISDIVSAAASVNGVLAVSIVSPSYNGDNDLIAVQPYEKAFVLDAEQDITVAIIGE
jgi:uncharacterized phage protein gp47/JayE